jgi:hypothetical protein
MIVQTVSIEMRDLIFVWRARTDKSFRDQSVNTKRPLFASADGKLHRSITLPPNDLTTYRVTGFSCRRVNNATDVAKFGNLIMGK